MPGQSMIKKILFIGFLANFFLPPSASADELKGAKYFINEVQNQIKVSLQESKEHSAELWSKDLAKFQKKKADLPPEKAVAEWVSLYDWMWTIIDPAGGFLTKSLSVSIFMFSLGHITRCRAIR